MQAVMVIDSEEFTSALKRLKPRRGNKVHLEEEMYIAFFNGEAIFCARGIQTRCRAESADWFDYILVSSRVVLSYLISKPISPVVRLVVDQKTLRMDNVSMRCTVMRSPEWLTAMSFDAHLYDDQASSPQDISMYCPKCGKKRGAYCKPKAIKSKATAVHSAEHQATRYCKACQHSWLEFGDLQKTGGTLLNERSTHKPNQ
jgi:hypothetical protein